MKITLTEWEIFFILREFEDLLCISNRDNKNTKALYEKIANQLNKQNITILEQDENKELLEQKQFLENRVKNLEESIRKLNNIRSPVGGE